MNKSHELYGGICLALSILSMITAYFLYSIGYHDFIIQFLLAIPFLISCLSGIILIVKSNNEQKVKNE